MSEMTGSDEPRPQAAPAVRSSAHIAGLDPRGPGPATAGIGFIVTGAALCFLITLGQTSSIPVLLTLTRAIDFTEAVGATWATFLPLILGAALTPLFSRLSDLYGRRRILVICLALAMVGAIIGPLGTGNPGEVVSALIGRAVQGAGIAAVPIVLAAAREVLSPQRMITALAVFGGALGMGGILGLSAGEVIFHLSGWKPMFWANAAWMALLIVAVMLTMPPQRPRLRPRLDKRGAALLTPSIIILMTVTVQAAEWGHQSVATFSAVAVGLALFVTWIVTAVRTRSPLLNLRSFRHPSVVFAHLSSFALGWILITNALLIAIQVQEENVASGQAWAPEATLLVALPSLAALLFVAPCAAAIAQRFGPKALLVVGAILAPVGFVLRVYVSPTSIMGIVWATIIAIGATLATTALPMILNLVTSAQRIGALNGMNWMLRLCGMTIGAATVIDIATNFTIDAGGTATPTWQSMWVVLMLSALVSVLLVLFAVLLPLPSMKRAPVPAR